MRAIAPIDEVPEALDGNEGGSDPQELRQDQGEEAKQHGPSDSTLGSSYNRDSQAVHNDHVDRTQQFLYMRDI